MKRRKKKRQELDKYEIILEFFYDDELNGLVGTSVILKHGENVGTLKWLPW